MNEVISVKCYCQFFSVYFPTILNCKMNFILFNRETALLVDPENSSSAAKQWVGLVVGELFRFMQSVKLSWYVYGVFELGH